MRGILFTLIFVFSFFGYAVSQKQISNKLDWKLTAGSPSFLYYNTVNGINTEKIAPIVHKFYLPSSQEVDLNIVINKERVITSAEANAFNLKEIPSEIKPSVVYKKAREERFALLSLIPAYYKNNSIYLIEDFDFVYSVKNISSQNLLSERSERSFKSSSVLASGDFYKINTSQNGVYKITYEYLLDNNVVSGAVPSSGINIYGNHSGMLPELNALFRYDDIEKNSIEVIDGGDNMFEEGDYILFYAESPDKWRYNSASGLFFYDQHLYANFSSYFITVNDNSGPKRINNVSSLSSTPTNTMTSFNDFQGREVEKYNLMAEGNRGGSGKKWYGELFDVQLGYTFNYSFPSIEIGTNVHVKTSLAAFSPGTDVSNFSINVAGNVDNIAVPGVPNSSYAKKAVDRVSDIDFAATSSNIPVSIVFSKSVGGVSQGWLDYIEINARRNLVMTGNQLLFRDVNSVGSGNVTSFNLTNASNVSQIWDVTDPINCTRLNTVNAGSDKSFVFGSDSLKTFIAFQNNGFLTPIFDKKIANQNLHGQASSDVIIVYHASFKNQVDKLASFHESKGLTVVKAEIQEVYNEFSSGMQDITAIKMYAKMLYDKANPIKPSYLLLFGSGSYDYKGRVSPNNNFVPLWESQASLDDLSSYTSDDYYGILDDNEGFSDFDLLDVSVGRLTVKTPAEAEIVVNKIINYQKEGVSLNSLETCNASNSDNAYGDWRNILAFVSDDAEENWEMAFFRHLEKISDSIEKNYPIFNLEKLHMDAYKQESTPGGERYYDGSEAIRRRVENGCLIITYEGHGGEVGWAGERILDLAMINAWTNYNKLPVFLTATCEFTKYDDPSRTSAGEQLLLNDKGGTVALFSTTRPVFQSSNEKLIEAFFAEAFIKKADGSPRTLGDIYLKTKNNALVIGNNNARRFSLVGDPALDLAFSKHQVFTNSVNNVEIIGVIDTMKALSKITISGYVADQTNSIISNYNGYVYPTVFDKKQNLYTLGNNSAIYVAPFDVQKSVLYKGKATVKNGKFSFSFVVPKDINYTYGDGKISYYAFNGNEDAAGYTNTVKVGGTSNLLSQDNEGPQIQLFLNDENFVSGGITSETPILYAQLFDSNGINTTGNGIGHDLTAIIDKNTSQEIVLNNYYESEADTYQKGKVVYQMSTLTEGNHTLSLKAWDVYNNSSERTIDFVVVKNEKLAIEHVLNYPNPFTTRTQFFFEHNQSCESLDVQVQVFTVSGKLVKTINKQVLTHGYRVDPIEWDGKDDYGDNIGRGTYVYRLKVTDNDNNKVEKFEKLVILK